MAENKDKRAAALAFWSQRLFAMSSRVAAFFATRASRYLIIIVFVILALYLAYSQAWQPILATAPLPPGVADQSPKLNTGLLETINSQRIERIETVHQQWLIGTLLQPPAQL